MVSAAFRESAYGPETAAVWLVLATIEHKELDDPIRVVNNLTNITSRGIEFVACPFEVQLPSESDEAPPRARVHIDNVSQDVTISLREIDAPPKVKFEVIEASAPDVVELTEDGFTLQNVVVTETTITGQVGLDDFQIEPFPTHSFTPTYFRGGFS